MVLCRCETGDGAGAEKDDDNNSDCVDIKRLAVTFISFLICFSIQPEKPDLYKGFVYSSLPAQVFNISTVPGF